MRDNPNPNITAIILAAGLSSRMGCPKLLLPWGKSTVISSILNTVVSAGILNILIVTGKYRSEIKKELNNSGFAINFVHNKEFEDGEMIHSIQVGIRAIKGHCDAFLLVLGDQPRIDQDVIQMILDCQRSSEAPFIVPSFRMKRGHPWLIGKSLWNAILEIKPPDTMRSFLRQHQDQIKYVNVDSENVLMDLDTPEDYERFRPN